MSGKFERYTRRIVVPRILNLAEHVYDLRLESVDLSFADRCAYDFRECVFAEPFAILLLAEKIKYLSKKFSDCEHMLLVSDNEFTGFADHSGLWRYMGWPRGRQPGEAWGSRQYVPIETFDLSDLRLRAESSPVGRLVNEEAFRLASVLTQTSSGPTYDIIQYAIREILRNAAEHSRGTRVTIMAQYWPTRHEAEIVIIDDGVGIPRNLYDNEYIECKDGREALKFALLPGISGVSREERYEQDEYWGNSGFGLYVTSRICSSDGRFRIISDRQGLTLAGGNQIEHPRWQLHGTCVQMYLRTRNASKIQKRIPEIIEDGERRRRDLMSAYPIQASSASKMLASQFKKKPE